MIRKRLRYIAMGLCVASMGFSMVGCGKTEVTGEQVNNGTVIEDSGIVNGGTSEETESIVEETDENSEVTENKEIVSTGNEVKVHFLNIKGGQSILVEDNGKYLLIGGGGPADKDKIMGYLGNMGIKKIDYVMLTHWQEEDTGALPNVLSKYFVDYLFTPEHTDGEDACSELKGYIETNKVLGFLPSEKTEYKLNKAKFRVYNTESNSRDANDAALVVELTHGNDKFLFMSDGSVRTEKYLKGVLSDVDVLQVGLHGSKDATSQEFLDIVKPEISVIQSDGTSADAPNKIVLDRLTENGSEILKTWEGDIVLKSTGNGILK